MCSNSFHILDGVCVVPTVGIYEADMSIIPSKTPQESPYMIVVRLIIGENSQLFGLGQSDALSMVEIFGVGAGN